MFGYSRDGKDKGNKSKKHIISSLFLFYTLLRTARITSSF